MSKTPGLFEQNKSRGPELSVRGPFCYLKSISEFPFFSSFIVTGEKRVIQSSVIRINPKLTKCPRFVNAEIKPDGRKRREIKRRRKRQMREQLDKHETDREDNHTLSHRGKNERQKQGRKETRRCRGSARGDVP